MILTSTHNMCYYGELKKFIFNYYQIPTLAVPLFVQTYCWSYFICTFTAEDCQERTFTRAFQSKTDDCEVWFYWWRASAAQPSKYLKQKEETDVKILKIRTPSKFAVIILTLSNVVLPWVMPPKDADSMANSVACTSWDEHRI